MIRPLFYLLILLTSTVQAQNVDKSQAIDELLLVAKVKQGTEQIMAGLIKQYIRKKPNAPMSLEQDIQKSLDYHGYMTKVKAVYDELYTEAEIKELTQLYKSENYELYKQKSERVAQKLYDIGADFGKTSVKTIVAVLEPY